jgi:hypothetical protein
VEDVAQTAINSILPALRNQVGQKLFDAVTPSGSGTFPPGATGPTLDVSVIGGSAPASDQIFDVLNMTVIGVYERPTPDPHLPTLPHSAHEERILKLNLAARLDFEMSNEGQRLRFTYPSNHFLVPNVNFAIRHVDALLPNVALWIDLAGETVAFAVVDAPTFDWEVEVHRHTLRATMVAADLDADRQLFDPAFGRSRSPRSASRCRIGSRTILRRGWLSGF